MPSRSRAASDEILMFSLPIIMGERRDLDDVVTAVAKIAAYAGC
jgi:hypothetical protein